jgi:Flp pilus assembly protein TadG
MRIHRPTTRHRGGSTLVESAMVLSVFLLFLFGIFEYGRFLFLTQVATNAARAGARYASINTDKDSTFVTTDFNATTPSIKKFVINQMGGVNTMIVGFDVSVFPCDTVKSYQDPPVIEAKAAYTAWNDPNASATSTPRVQLDRIGVKILGDYKPILPVFVFFYSNTSRTIPLNITACSGGEG